MFEKLILQIKTQSTIKAAILIALIVIGAYAPVIFLGQSYDQANPVIPKFVGINEKSWRWQTAIDPAGVSQQNPPVYKLARDLILEGKIPLWDPYVGTGFVLAADTDNYVFSPIFLGYLLPIELWDVPIFIALWVAGFSTFLFLRKLDLNFPGSLSGGIMYMLSGMFTLFFPHNLVGVITFTPLIFYALEKVIQERQPKFIILLSIGFCFSILGAHLECLILQFLLVCLYFLYRVIYLYKCVIRNSLLRSQYGVSEFRKIMTWPFFGFVGGIGLSAFLILPIYELTKNWAISHSPQLTWKGDNNWQPLYFAQNFLPYLHGLPHAFWNTNWASNVLTSSSGYVSIFSLFFSICAVYFFIKKTKINLHTYTPIFFFIVAIFFILVQAGTPIFNLITDLPVFNLIAWSRYVGIIISFALAISAAFGINSLTKEMLNKKTLVVVGFTTVAIILLVSVPALQLLYNFGFYSENAPGSNFWVAFQIFQSITLVSIITIMSITTIQNRSAFIGLILCIFLELSIYIPMGLDPFWTILKSTFLLSCMIVITFLFRRLNLLSLHDDEKIRLYFIIGIMFAIICGEVLISYISPDGMLKMRDPFETNPPIEFLEKHIGYSRIFSLDSFAPNFPVAYHLSTIGIMSAFNTQSFYDFGHNFLGEYTNATSLDYPPVVYVYGPVNSTKLISENKYYDFLGVKYFLTSGYDLNSFTPEPGTTFNYTSIGSHDNNVTQYFISPYDSIKEIGIALGTYSLDNHGVLILTLDSIPYDKQNHRQVSLNVEKINSTRFNKFKIEPQLSGILHKELLISLTYPEAKGNTQKIAAYLLPSEKIGYNSGAGTMEYDTSKDYSIGYETVKNLLDGKFYKNGTLIENRQLDFYITNGIENYPKVFEYKDINIYENPNSFPRTFLVNQFVLVGTNQSQDYILNHPEFDLRNNVVLEGNLPKSVIYSLNLSKPDKTSNAEITLYDADKVKIITHNHNSSLLVFTDLYYPGWKAYVDGTETQIYLADGLVRTIFVPVGDHNVEFSYEPMSFKIGLIISLITTIAMISFLCYLKIRTRSSLKKI